VPLFDRSEQTRVVDEAGSVTQLGDLARELGAERVFVVTDPGVVRVGHVAAVEDSLARAGLSFARFEDVRHNPTTEDVDRCLEAARAFGPDLFLGFGGGSAIDVAKGANFLLCCGGRMHDYRGRAQATAPLLPMIAVPTTAGTGSEVQSFALIADAETHLKMACGDPSAAPRIAVLDARTTLTLPAEITAITGLDALGHAVESAVTTRRNETSAAYAREAFALLCPSFPRVLERPESLEARSDMLRGSAYAGLAIESSMLGAAHALANPLTARFDVPHGQAVGTALPHVVRFNAEVPEVRAIYADLAHAGGLIGVGETDAEAAETLAETLGIYLVAAGLPAGLGASGVTAADCAELGALAAEQWTGGFNPRPVDAGELESLYRAAL